MAIENKQEFYILRPKFNKCKDNFTLSNFIVCNLNILHRKFIKYYNALYYVAKVNFLIDESISTLDFKKNVL